MFYDIYLYTLCYYICCLLWRMYEMHPALFLKTGCYTIKKGTRSHQDWVGQCGWELGPTTPDSRERLLRGAPTVARLGAGADSARRLGTSG
jgi:hypothetical protein